MNKVRKILTSKVFVIILLFTVVTFLGLVGYKWVVRKDTISSIAYNNFKEKDDYRVYVKEDGNYVPFLVIANEYVPGSTLLLREEILSEERRMNDYSAYYKDSEIDSFLNNEYYNSLEDIHHLIKNTSIEIMTDESIGISGDEVEYINRRIFLISGGEIVPDLMKDGDKIFYFDKPKNRLSYKNGEPVSWLLRTPNTWYHSVVCGIAHDGSIGSANSSDLFGIRPAFCVDSSAKIKKKEGIIDGKKVYVLE